MKKNFCNLPRHQDSAQLSRITPYSHLCRSFLPCPSAWSQRFFPLTFPRCGVVPVLAAGGVIRLAKPLALCPFSKQLLVLHELCIGTSSQDTSPQRARRLFRSRLFSSPASLHKGLLRELPLAPFDTEIRPHLRAAIVRSAASAHLSAQRAQA